jgi:predicted NACHT family NTPase
VALQSIQINASKTQADMREINAGINTLVEILQTIAQPTTADSKITYSSRFEREMKNWFEVLGYRFEKYENRMGRSFEWIINVATRRGYDRIFVYAIEGEAEMGDLDYVQTKIEELRTQEGWLVSAFRISQATRDAVAQLKDRTVFCYTFDELLEESADFSGYFKWLENEVLSKGIDRIYIPLACKKQELDQNNGQSIGTSRYDERNGWLDGYVDRWLDDPNKEHLSILGEFGMGKTWFSLHYAWSSLKKYQDAKALGRQRPRIPLVIPLRDYAKAVSIESLFSEFFFRKYEIPIPGYSAFESLNRMGKLLLIFDGFDEMASKVDRQKM